MGGRSVEVCFFCTSISEISMAGAAAATGTEPDSAPQYPLNTSIWSPVAMILVSETRAVPDNIHAAHELIGAVIGVDFVNHERLHLKGLRLASPGEGKPARDVVDQQAKWLPLAANLFNQHFPQRIVGDLVGTLDDEVALARDGRQTDLATAVSIRLRKAIERLARHFEIAQYAFIHERHALRRRALVIEWVEPQQHIRAEFRVGGIVHDGKETRQDLLAHLARKGLTFVDVLLPKTFVAMAKHLAGKIPRRRGR